ncbi:hypothetical protein GOBAR_AA16145 [Gossypium barbadense]|uniref:Uncharacterized protein n=1 Tax=Gossypium barbadense TaxID=3634 RepID=A0A2P5XMF6_GOSBA|nr:hypothetical protein GOBAR_AA16145 [Gossypium barbadense]
MLTKFILVSESHFQNTETALKNQQVSIQGLETQIAQLAKLISERPQGSLLSNTESNPREQLNAITVRVKEGLFEPEPESRQEIVGSKGKVEVDHNEQKSVSREYKPRVAYPSAKRKDHTDEQVVKFLKEVLADKRKLDEALHETCSRSIHEPCSSNNKGPIYEERRLQIEELDEWRAQKPRTHDKPKPRHDRLNVSQNQLKVGDKVLLDAANPRIATSEPNRAITFTVLNIFSYGTVEVTHSKFGRLR